MVPLIIAGKVGIHLVGRPSDKHMSSLNKGIKLGNYICGLI